MSNPTFVRKVYVDSRMATSTSRSNSDFDITLSRNIVLPQKAAGFITDIQIPHSWYCVDVGHRYLYFSIDALSTFIIKIGLAKGNYTGEQLADEIRARMHAKIATLSVVGQLFYVQYESQLNVLRYSLAPQLNFVGNWTDPAGDVFTIAAGVKDTYSITEEKLSYYDLSTTTWSTALARFKLKKVTNTSYTGE